jgi:CDP-diacylglycerol--glycerol-3-phosphate 3-phosphatidyltransferase
MDHGNKIFDEHQNPIDNILLVVCKQIAPFLYRNKITPNMITFFGLITGIISIYFLIKKQYFLCFIFLWITYWSDCLDGYIARKYDQVTLFGDYFDHVRDNFVVITLVVFVIMQIKTTQNKILVAIILFIFFILMNAQLGCQEKLTPYTMHNDCLALTKMFCIGNAEKTIYVTKWFGCGTFILVLSLIIIYLKYQ